MRYSCLLLSISFYFGTIASGQVANNSNSFPSNNSASPAYIGSSTVASPVHKLYVGASMKLFQSGNSGFSSPSLYLANTTSGARTYFINSNSTGLLRVVDSNANADRFVINSSGNIGINISSPSYRLDVNGTMQATGLLVPTGNVGIGISNPAYPFHVSPVIYSAGTASQFGTTITGSGTAWWDGFIGGYFVFADGTRRTITGFTSGNQLTVAESGTVSSQAYKIHYQGLSVSSDGKTTIATNDWVEDLLTVKSGIGTWGAGVAKFVSVSPYASGTYNTIVCAFAPNIPVGNNINAYQFGKDRLAVNNSATWLFRYNGDQSSSNYAALAFWGSPEIVRFNPNGITELNGDVYTGNGITNASPASKMISATGGAGTNITGANLVVAAGKGTGNAAGGYLDFQTADAGATGTTLQSLTSKMRIISNGNVGIGTTNPTNKFHVNGSVKFEGLSTNNSLTNILAADAYGNLSWRDAATLGGSGSSQWTTTASNIYYNTGKVGIGTTSFSDAYKLFVEGSVRARKVRVDQQVWPDYVFHDQYKLFPIKELEKFIQQNKHLPDVPTAAEVEKQGIDLGDNQSILLKKIEELTLYIIDMNKKIEKLSAENETMKKKLGIKEK